MQNAEVAKAVVANYRMPCPANCPPSLYSLMLQWYGIKQSLFVMLELSIFRLKQLVCRTNTATNLPGNICSIRNNRIGNSGKTQKQVLREERGALSLSATFVHG
jgi:hypothetical protein